MTNLLPTGSRERDQWVETLRGPKPYLDPYRPSAFMTEQETGPGGEPLSTCTLFLTNRECPWRCVMCDLWRTTLDTPTPPGAVPAQIDYALERLQPASQIKLYNSGSFFDQGAIPFSDYPAIAKSLASFDRVIVESHPALIGNATLRFQELLEGELEVAMGLETCHPEVLHWLNKRINCQLFEHSARTLKRNGIALRVFLLVHPPFMEAWEAEEWLMKSIDFAFHCGADVISLVPTRTGNGAMNYLEENGAFQLTTLKSLEFGLAYGLRCKRGRVFADLWDVAQFNDCKNCFDNRLRRLRQMNRTQLIHSSEDCPFC